MVVTKFSGQHDAIEPVFSPSFIGYKCDTCKEMWASVNNALAFDGTSKAGMGSAPDNASFNPAYEDALPAMTNDGVVVLSDILTSNLSADTITDIYFTANAKAAGEEFFLDDLYLSYQDPIAAE